MGLFPVCSVAPLVKLPKCGQFEGADTVMLIMWLLAGSAHLYIWSGLPDLGRSLKPQRYRQCRSSCSSRCHFRGCRC